MQADGWIVRSGQSWALTDEGRRFVERRLYDDVDGPDRLPFAVKAAPMASGSAVVKDGLTWDQLAQMGVRTVAALEMEAATVATVARLQQIPHWLVVKGVMDHADPRKDDRYKRFAARASAEVLYSLVTRLIVPRGVEEPVSRRDPSPGVSSWRGRVDTPETTQPGSPAAATNIDDLTDAQQRTLQMASEHFGRHDEWPTFNLIDRPLRRQGIDAASAVMAMPVGLLVGVRAGAQPTRDDPIQLTIRGMARCQGTEQDVELFLAVARWAAVLDDEFDPGHGPSATARLTSHAVAAQFHADSRAVCRLYAMLRIQRWGFGSGGGQPDDWWWEIDRDIHRFAAVTTAEEYDQARAAWVAESTQALQTHNAEPASASRRAAPAVRRAAPAERLDQLAASDPQPDAAARVNGRLYLVVRPRDAVDDMLGAICTPSAAAELNAAVQRAVAGRLREAQFAPDFSTGSWRRSSRGIHHTNGVREDGSIREASLLALTICEDGSVTVLCGRATDQARPMWKRVGVPEPDTTRPVIFPDMLLGLSHSALALAVDLGKRVAHYDGPWDIGLRLTGIKDAIAYDYVRSGDEDVVHYDEDTYERTAVATTTDLAANAAGLAERLVAPLLRALTIDSRYLPYRTE